MFGVSRISSIFSVFIFQVRGSVILWYPVHLLAHYSLHHLSVREWVHSSLSCLAGKKRFSNPPGNKVSGVTKMRTHRELDFHVQEYRGSIEVDTVITESTFSCATLPYDYYLINWILYTLVQDNMRISHQLSSSVPFLPRILSTWTAALPLSGLFVLLSPEVSFTQCYVS